MAELLDELGYPREVTKEEVVSAFLQTIQRSLNCLSAEEQKIRRNALEKLHASLLKDDGAGSLPPMDVLQAAWDEVILEKVLRCVSDSTERCRELAIQLMREVAQSLTEVDCTLKAVVPVMEERMGQPPVLECSEEIRLQLFSLLIDVLLPECELPTLQNLIDPLHRIVAVTLFDQFHEVQKKACSVLVTMADRDPEVFGNKTGVFLRGLVPCLNHAHSRVRIAVFQAIDAMMQCGLTKSLVAQQLAPGTKSLAFDHTPAVRELFFTSVGNWLNFKSRTMSDEEIHQCVTSGKIPRFHLPELLPLLLLGITDDCIDIATLTYERLEGIGELYKKLMDHLDKQATHGRGGQRFRTAEEDAKLMEKVMEEERKCEEKYQRELREAEEQRRLQREGNSTSDDTTTQSEELAQGPSLYQSLKAQTSSMEEELNQGVRSAEKIFDADLQLSEVECSKTTGSPNSACRLFLESPQLRLKTTNLTIQANQWPQANRCEAVVGGFGYHHECGLVQGKPVRTSPDASNLNEPDKEPPDSDEEPLHPDKEPPDTDKEPSDSDKEPPDSDREPLHPDKEPLDSDKEPLHPDKEPPNTNKAAPNNYKEPLDPDKEPPYSDREPVDHDKEPPDSDREPLHVDNEPPDSDKGRPPQHEEFSDSIVLSDTKIERGAGTGMQESKEENLSTGASGLHILTLERPLGTETSLNQKNTSEITDEGAVKKLNASKTGVEILQLPKPWKGRPNAGCRLMIEAFLRPVIEPALRELKQWTTPTRLSAARFLHTLMVLAEGLAKDNLNILIPAFFSAVGDDEVKVAKRVVATIHIIGFHVPPRKWLSMVLKPLGNTNTSQAQRANVLVVTAAFLYGTPRKAMEEKHVVKICDKLYEKEVCCSNHSAVQIQLLSVVTNLIQVAGALCKSSSFKIFVLLLRLQSVEGDAQLQKRSGQVLEDLAQGLGMESARELYVQHIHSLLDAVTAGHEGWSSNLPGKLLFQTFMRNANDTVGPYLESLMPLFGVCLQSDQDPTLRISFLQLLNELFAKPELESSWAPLAPDVFSKLLIPCAVWRASKTEAAVRYSAMVAIATFLRRDLCSQEHLQEIMKTPEGLLPVLETCMDEEYFLDVRRASTHVMYQFLRISGPILSDEERTDLIKVLSKRMDDSSNLIRRAILPAVAMFFTTMPSTFSDSQVRDFLSFLVVHMDDEHPHIQEGVCRAMEACVVKKPEIVADVLCNVRDHQRSPEYIDRVLHARAH